MKEVVIESGKIEIKEQGSVIENEDIGSESYERLIEDIAHKSSELVKTILNVRL